jgi:hypothetical protein
MNKAINWQEIGFVKNPFTIEPDRESNNLIWAGFKNNKKKLDGIISNSISSGNTNLFLNLSRWGGGKTHTAYYYKSYKNLPIKLDDERESPFHIILNTPKSGDKADLEFFIHLIESFKIRYISKLVQYFRAEYGDEDSLDKLIDWTKSEDLGKIVWLLGEKNDDVVFNAKQVLFNPPTQQVKNKLKISRGIVSTDDRFQIIAALIKLISQFDKSGKLNNSRQVFLWLDELESLVYYTSKQYRPFTQAIRDLIANVPTNLTVFLNFSFSEPDDIRSVELVIGAALLDRVTDKIIFDEVNNQEALIYVSELFKHYRILEFNQKAFFPFSEDSLVSIFELINQQSGKPLLPRTINKGLNHVINNYYEKYGVVDEGINNLPFINRMIFENI